MVLSLPLQKEKKNSHKYSLRFNFTSIQMINIIHNFSLDHRFIFGELQYSFVVFLLGENLEAFEQWKKIFILLTSCDDLTRERPQAFVDFIRKRVLSDNLKPVYVNIIPFFII